MTPQNLENLLIGMKKPPANHEMFRQSI